MIKQLFTALLALSSFISHSATLPIPTELKGKTITVVVPYGPGGNSDVVARQLAGKVTAKTGMKTIVVNKPGASGSLGAEFVATSKPDGLTICQCETGPAFLNTIMKLPGSPDKGSLLPVSGSIESILAIVVAGNAPFNDMKELMAYLKKNNTKAAYASTGSMSLIWSEQLLNFGGVKGVESLLYKSQAEALTSVLSGVTVFVVAGTGDAVRLVDSGKLKAIAVGSQKRLPIWPDVPTMKETFPKMVMTNFNGIYVPKETPSNIQEFINSAWSDAVWDVDTIAVLHAKGILPIGGDLKRAQAFHDMYYADREQLYKKYGKLLDKK